MLAHCLWHWPKIVSASGQRIVVAGYVFSDWWAPQQEDVLTRDWPNAVQMLAQHLQQRPSLDQRLVSAGIVGSWRGSQTAELGQTVGADLILQG